MSACTNTTTASSTCRSTAAQVFFRMPDAVTEPRSLRRRRRPGAPATAADLPPRSAASVRIVDWQQANSSLFNAVEIERNVMFLILTLIILVAAFNIISGMIMMVKDKGRDIAILRTMGASRGMILRIFMLSGASIGVVGTLAGFVLGVRLHRQHRGDPPGSAGSTRHRSVLRRDLFLHPHAGAASSRGEVAAVVIMALALSFLATLYPVLARRPARSGRGAALRVTWPPDRPSRPRDERLRVASVRRPADDLASRRSNCAACARCSARPASSWRC